MRQRYVILREEGSSIGAVSLLALFVLAGLIALMIWQPWDGLVTVQKTTVTSSLDGTSGTR